MNVLHIGTATHWRGGENQVYLLASELAKSYASNNYFAYPQKSAAIERFRDLGPVFELKSSLPFDNSQIENLVTFAKENEIQIAHAHCSKSHSIGLKLKKYFPKLKLIVHRRVAFKDKLINFSQSKYLSEKVDSYIAISEAVKKTLIHRGVSQNKIYVVSSAVNLQNFKDITKNHARHNNLSLFADQISNLSEDTVLIGSASALTKEKGLDIFIEALLELQKFKDLPPYAVIFAGEGKLKNKLEEEAQALSTPHIFAGFIKNTPLFLSGLDIFVLPSQFEGLGSAGLEAMAAGCCVIGSTAGGIKEFVFDNETGLSFPPGDHKALAEQLKKAIKDETLRKRLNKKGLSLIENKYSVEHMAASTLQIYQRVSQR